MESVKVHPRLGCTGGLSKHSGLCEAILGEERSLLVSRIQREIVKVLRTPGQLWELSEHGEMVLSLRVIVKSISESPLQPPVVQSPVPHHGRKMF